MKWIILAFGLMAFTPLHIEHDSTKKIDDEFRNGENTWQDQQYTIINSTPPLTTFKDGQIMVYSSGSVNALLWRVNDEIYVLRGSCVTVWR